MGVYIKGMEMPENCALCPMWDAGDCLTASEAIICEYDKRPSDCPLVHIQPHGRLVDADRLGFAMMDAANADQALAMVDDAPTIIPAEEGE